MPRLRRYIFAGGVLPAFHEVIRFSHSDLIVPFYVKPSQDDTNIAFLSSHLSDVCLYSYAVNPSSNVMRFSFTGCAMHPSYRAIEVITPDVMLRQQSDADGLSRGGVSYPGQNRAHEVMIA